MYADLRHNVGVDGSSAVDEDNKSDDGGRDEDVGVVSEPGEV